MVALTRIDALHPSRLKLAPSLLSADFSDLRGELTRTEAGGADWIHLDVMDGHFVPNITFGAPVIARLREHSSLPFDCHLMIEHPERYIGDFAKAGCDLITVHAEACTHLHRVLAQIKEAGVRVGVALNPHTPLVVLEHVLDLVDLVLLMSVNPGFGGQSFLPLVVPKLAQLRAMCSRAGVAPEVEVDGGITLDTAGAAVRAGASVLVAGSAIFGKPDLGAAMAAIRVAAQ